MAADSSRDSSADVNPFRDLTKTLEQFKMPGVDMNAFVDSRRKDVEALVAANRITYDALQTLAKTQAEMLTRSMQDMQESAKGFMTGTTNSSDITRHAEAAQKAWQKMVADMKQLTEIVQKAQVEAMTGLAERAHQSIGELTGPAHKK